MIFVLLLVMSEFVVAGAYSEVETNFVIMGLDGSENSSFWDICGDYFVASVVVLVIVVVYLNAIRNSRKRKRK